MSNCSMLKASHDGHDWPNNTIAYIPTVWKLPGFDVTDNKTNVIGYLRLGMDDKFHREIERLKTFHNWPLTFIDRRDLARTGMYYTGEEDKVKCYFCEVEIGKWDPKDEAVSEHMRWSPNCPLLRRRTTNNIAINCAELDRILPAVSYDICGANDDVSGGEMLSTGYQQEQQQQQQQQSLAAGAPPSQVTYPEGSTRSGPVAACFPEFPEYAVEEARKRSFAEWPLHMKQRPEELAAAGFFYTGKGDRVKCYSCGGGLKDWHEHDEPWEQHALWMKNCHYVKLMKGQCYIDAVLAKYANVSESDTEEVGSTEKQEQQQQQVLTTKDASAYVEQKSSNIGTATAVTSNVVGDVCCPQHDAAVAVAATATAATGPATTVGVVKCPSSVAAAATADDVTPPTVTVNGTTATATTTATADRRSANSTIPEEKLCKICYGSEYNTAFLPCGHVVACAKCASSVTKCPLCRKPFTDVMRVYFS